MGQQENKTKQNTRLPLMYIISAFVPKEPLKNLSVPKSIQLT